ncbi:MAG: C39 family peptidase [Verrucomicrobiota bacterium]
MLGHPGNYFIHLLAAYIYISGNCHAAEMSYEKLNEVFGFHLFVDENLLDDPVGDLAERLGANKESETQNSMTFRSGRKLVLGLQAETIMLIAAGGQIAEATFMFVNKGDSVSRIRKQEPKATERKIYKRINEEIREGSDQIENTFTGILGKPDVKQIGISRDVREVVKNWKWKNLMLQLSEQENEFLSFRILPAEGEGPELMRDLPVDAFRMKLEANVEKRDNGDVIIKNIPMVNQGHKGYCVPATWSRYLNYVGVLVDEYQLARAAGTDLGGGTTFSGIVRGATQLARRNRLSVDTVRSKMSMTRISRYIDKGMPIMWGMRAVGPFQGTGASSDRMEGMSPSEWKLSLKSQRRAARDLEKVDNNYHMCMIIGYNEETDEICTSDSWGREHEEKWYTLEEVEAVSMGYLYVLQR